VITESIQRSISQLKQWEKDNSMLINRNAARIAFLLNPDDIHDCPPLKSPLWGKSLFKSCIRRGWNQRKLLVSMHHAPCKGYGYVKFTARDPLYNITRTLILKDVDVADSLAWFHKSSSIHHYEKRYFGTTDGKEPVRLILNEFTIAQVLEPFNFIPYQRQRDDERKFVLSYAGIFGVSRERDPLDPPQVMSIVDLILYYK
jgi:hypothetical protein